MTAAKVRIALEVDFRVNFNDFFVRRYRLYALRCDLISCEYVSECVCLLSSAQSSNELVFGAENAFVKYGSLWLSLALQWLCNGSALLWLWSTIAFLSNALSSTFLIHLAKTNQFWLIFWLVWYRININEIFTPFRSPKRQRNSNLCQSFRSFIRFFRFSLSIVGIILKNYSLFNRNKFQFSDRILNLVIDSPSIASNWVLSPLETNGFGSKDLLNHIFNGLIYSHII